MSYMKKIVGIVFLIVIAGALLFAVFNKSHREKQVVDTMPQSVVSSSTDSYQLEHTQCHDSDNYLVVEQPVAEDPGSNILIKYKKATEDQIPCSYSVAKGDFELRNPGGADYFTAITSHFLVTNSGTAVNNRIITVYDLNTQKEVFHDLYSSGDPIIAENTISYWKNTDKVATQANCSELSKGANTIVARMAFDLITLSKKDLHENRCVYQE